MIQLYSAFERARMIRKGAQLVAPPISTLRDYQLPVNSFLHYVSPSKIEVGPGSDNPLLRQYTKPIQIYSPLELVAPPNNPRKVVFDSNSLIRGYLLRNRRVRRLTDLDKMPKDDKTLVIANYALLHHSYKYIRSLFADYNEWVDTMYTVMATANTVALATQRNQFLVIDVPKVLPAISRLNMASSNMDQNSLKIFNNDGARMLLEIWKWLSPTPIPNVFDRIEPKHYRYVNLIIQDSNQWVCINLDRLHWWRKSTVDKYREDVKKKTVDSTQVKPYESTNYDDEKLQKYVLRMYMTLASARSETGIDGDAQMQAALADPATNDKNGKAPKAKGEDGEDEEFLEVPNSEDEEEIAVKKGNDLEDSTDSSRSLNANGVKSSEELLRDAARLTSKEDDDSSKFEINADVDAMIDADLAELEKINASEESRDVVNPVTGEVLPLAVDDTRPYEEKTKDRCNVLAEAGLLTGAEYRRLTTLSEKYKSLPNPIPGGKGTLLDAMNVTDEELALDTRHIAAPGAVLLDESMRYSAIETGQQRYIKETLPKHILAMIAHVQSANVIIDNIEIERTETVTGSSLNYMVRLIPIEGAPTTLRFPVPEIQEDGTYTANAVKYSMRNQRRDFPIRKVAPSKVALTSYYGKFFVYRSRKAANDYSQWLINEVMALGFSPDIDRITDVKTANVFHMGVKAPRSISSLAKQVRQFTVKATDGESFVFHLDLAKIKEHFNMDIVQPWIDKGFVPVAISNKNHIVYYEAESFYLIKGEAVKPLGELEEILGLDITNSPAEYCELKIGGKYVPIGMILAYDYGLTELIRRLKIQTRRVPVGTRVNPQPDEVALVFNDETLLFNKSDRLATLLLGGFLEFKRVIRGFSITDFDNKGVYQNVLDSTGGGTRVLREINLARDLFVDPITKKVLTDLKQPTDFMGILVYAAELLMDDMHRPEFDMSEQRICGYERVAGAVYQELVKSMRLHSARPGKSRYPIEMKPFAIWQSLAQDQAIVVVKDINPLANLKQREEVTFTGNGGRSKDTMTASSREYGVNDIGIISEATKDSGEVGINTYTPPNPQLKNTLGMPVDKDKKELGMSSIFSSSVLASPAATYDDMKRMGFISIQHDHGVAVTGQMENIYSTGYDRVVGHRTSELFAVSAKQKGVVKEVTESGITVQYADGSIKGYPLGRQYGENAGMTIPHMLITPLKTGSKILEGDAITYNKGFFKPDTLNPRQIAWCNGTYANFALCEPSDVIEDASVISQELADMLMTEQTKQRTIVIGFNQAISRLIKVGDAVKYDDVLCIIQDEITSGLDLYDEADIDSLKALGSQAPKAKYDGVVERIEVRYRGDKEDMSENIRKLVNQGDRELANLRKSQNKTVVTGSVDEGYKVKGNSIPLDSVAIRIFITGPEAAGVGDKIVLVNQLKSIVGKVIKEPMQAQDGSKVLGRFSYTSIARRIVNSPDKVGTTVAILLRGAELAVAAYDS
jgi:hypothetical protein